MSTWWVTNTINAVGPIWLVCWVMWVILSITLHELAHGWMAIRCGDDVPYHAGHMTWNPLVHIPFPWAWLMFLLFGFTWGLMPTDPSNYRRRNDEARVAFAGPAMNLALAILCVIADILWLKFARGVGDPFFQNFHLFLFTGVLINVVGFIFNLVPLPPLDGSRILANFVPAYRRIWENESAQFILLVASGLLFFLGGRFVWPLGTLIAYSALAGGSSLVGVQWVDPI